jgi:hypothetical protein
MLEWEKEFEGQCRLLRLKKISSAPEKMAQGMEMHHHEFVQKYGAGPALCGNMAFQVNEKGKKVVAYAESYYPKAYPQRIHGNQAKSGTGISASLLESECLEHLKADAGVTHMTTTDGYYEADSKGSEKKTSDDRRRQLLARGIDPMKTYPIDEWIAKLRSAPDYSKLKK